jgi:hypothetical protein
MPERVERIVKLLLRRLQPRKKPALDYFFAEYCHYNAV